MIICCCCWRGRGSLEKNGDISNYDPSQQKFECRTLFQNWSARCTYQVRALCCSYNYVKAGAHGSWLGIYLSRRENKACFKRRAIADNRELTNRRLSHDAAAGSRLSSALPSCRNLNLRFVVKTTTLHGARGRQIFPPFLKFVFFFSQVSLFVQPKCLNS